MFKKFEIKIAFRYLRSKRKEGFISLTSAFSFLGIMLGVATLIVVMAVMNGFHAELLKRILGINAHISIIHKTGNIKEYKKYSEYLSHLSGVHSASPIIQGQVLATANDKHSGVMVRGINLKDIKNKSLIADNIVMGDFWNAADSLSKSNSVIIGSQMAKSMKLLPGDTIRLISPKTSRTFFGDMPRIKDYTITGIFEVGMLEYDSSTIFMPLSAAQTYFKSKNTVSNIEIIIRSPKNIDIVKADIKKHLGDDFYIIDWKESNSSFFNSLKVERTVMFLILTLIIIIAAFNIVSSMVMLVTSKNKEIAILRTIGVSRISVMKIFIICGSSIGILGTFFGFLIGVGFATNIESIRRYLESYTQTDLFSAQVYFLSQLPADVKSQDVLNVVILSIIISLIATIYPAWKAAKVSPIEGLRNE